MCGRFGFRIRPSPPQSGSSEPTVRTFSDEKKAFRSALPMLLSRHGGEWVAISDGCVADHDRDRKALTRRFFQNRTRGPVFIGFVGPRPSDSAGNSIPRSARCLNIATPSGTDSQAIPDSDLRVGWAHSRLARNCGHRRRSNADSRIHRPSTRVGTG